MKDDKKLLKLKKEGLSTREIARQLGITAGNVHRRLDVLKRKEKPYDPTDHRVMRLEDEIASLKAEKGKQSAQLNLYKKKAGVFEALVDEMHKIVTPFKALPKVSYKIHRGKVHEEDLVLHLSDEHMDEVVKPEAVQGLENYNFPIAVTRAERLVDLTLKLSQETLTNYRFKTLWVLAYGDHTSGEIHNSVDRSYYRNQFRNVFAIGQVHALMFRDLAPFFESIKVIYISGNHGRRGTKKDYHGPRNNWDYAIAETASMLCRDIENIEFVIPDSYSINVEIANHNFAIEHGDEIVSWNSIPFYGMERKSRRLVALNATQGLKIHYFVYGHFHKPSTIGDLDGETIINGSWKATDPYVFGRFSGFTEPSQWLHGVHPEQGITWRYKVKLRSPEEVKGPNRYKIELAQ